MRIKKALKILIGILAGILGLCLICLLVFVIANRKELKTIRSFKETNAADMYTMTYYADSHFDEYLKAGYTDNEALLYFLDDHFMHGMVPLIKKQDGYCSTFICHNEAGEVLFCRNFDRAKAAPCCMLTMEPENGYKNTTACDLGAVYYEGMDKAFSSPEQKLLLTLMPYFSLDGVNEKGVAISLLSSGKAQNGTKEDAVCLSVFDVIRVVLEKAATVDEAVELLNGYNVNFGNVYNFSPMHYMIADASGKSVVVEFLKDGMVTVESPVVTNFNMYGTGYGVGRDRYNIIENGLSESGGVMTEEQALNLLAKAVMPGMEQYSVIYNLTTGEISAFTHGDDSNVVHFEK